MNVLTLDTCGYVVVPYPSSLRSKVHHAMAAWQRFCALPQVEKNKLSGGDRVEDHGYMRRNDTGPKADNKELFHLIKRNMHVLGAQAETVSDRRAVEFIAAVDDLIDATKPLVVEFAVNVQKEYDIPGFARDVADSSSEWTFRFLHYMAGATAFAHAHPDRGGFTLHQHESHPGGQYLGFDKEWRDWPLSEEQTIIFPSMNLQHRSKGKLKALWHRVQPTEVTSVTGRFSMVAFIDFFSAHEFNKNAGIRTQDLIPGANYGESHEDFSQYFVPTVKEG